MPARESGISAQLLQKEVVGQPKVLPERFVAF
jgi:hypothetical protein